MKIFLSIALFTLSIILSQTTVGQINMADSTAQVVSYWEKGEKKNYTITAERIRLNGVDTTTNERAIYDIEVSVLNQTEKSYTIQWLYKDIKVSNTTTPEVQKILNISKGLKIIYKTDELGSFTEVVNWKEIKDYMQTVISALRKDFAGHPEMEKVLDQVVSTYSSKEVIEASATKEIQQFHTFHGGAYKLGEILQEQTKVTNVLGPEPFDCNFTVCLNEISEADNNCTLKVTQEVNKEQLTNATFEYLTKMAKNMNVATPKREDLSDLKNETVTISKILGTGWVVKSVQTRTIVSNPATAIEIRIIEMK